MSEMRVGATCRGAGSLTAVGRYIGHGLYAWVSAMTNDVMVSPAGEPCESGLPQITDDEVYTAEAVARYYAIRERRERGPQVPA